MIYWNVHVLSESAVDRPENRPPIQIKHVHSSISYHQVTLQKYDRRDDESPSGYGPLGLDKKVFPVHRPTGFIQYE